MSITARSEEMTLSEVRRNPRKHAVVGKKSQPVRVGF